MVIEVKEGGGEEEEADAIVPVTADGFNRSSNA